METLHVMNQSSFGLTVSKYCIFLLFGWPMFDFKTDNITNIVARHNTFIVLISFKYLWRCYEIEVNQTPTERGERISSLLKAICQAFCHAVYLLHLQRKIFFVRYQ